MEPNLPKLLRLPASFRDRRWMCHDAGRQASWSDIPLGVTRKQNIYLHTTLRVHISPPRFFSRVMPPSRHSTSAAPSVYQHPQSQAASHGPSLTLTLWIHDNLLSKQEAWLNYNLFPPGTCNPGDLVEVRPAHTNSNTRKGGGYGAGEGSSSAEGRIESGDDEGAGAEGRGRGGVAMKRSKSDGPQIGTSGEGRFLFVVREMERDLWLKQPNLQVYFPSTWYPRPWDYVSDLGWIDFTGRQCREPLRIPTSQFSDCDTCGYSKFVCRERSVYMLTTSRFKKSSMKLPISRFVSEIST